MNSIISHLKKISESEYEIQSNADHSKGVADLAESFAAEFGFGPWGKAIGLLHDKGKERISFQNYIKKVSGFDPNAAYNGEDKSHAFVGALLARKEYGPLSLLISNQIAGHHTGLYDCGEFEEIMKKDLPNEITEDSTKINVPTEVFRNFKHREYIHHLNRVLYSCLVDADYLDTERFMTPENYALRKNDTSMAELKKMLQTKLDEFDKVPDTPVNRIRKQVQDECLKTSTLPSGFFSLTVPTGGGKTISSIVWAVNHAIKNGKKRIIIAIPYTSIIVQTAAVLKGIFGEENVLEHHSNSECEQIKNPETQQKMRLATENWDYPIVITTNVQLFESMYSNKPSKCRKLHNLCNSILILDEVQTLPVEFLQPIVDSLKCYQEIFGISVLLTTASQPILSGEITGCNPRIKINGIEHIEEIIPESMQLHGKLRRVQLEIDDEGKSYDEVAEMLSRHQRVLCIVNTRKTAKEIFDRLPDEGLKLHLSRMMCPAHIRMTIESLNSELKSDNHKVIRVIATQLIEAGVDIDFPVVYRQETGLDSILQAAGRCNREGKLDICTTHVFSLGKEGNLPPGSVAMANEARKNIVGERDWFAPETMSEYFRQLYSRTQNFDVKNMAYYLYRPTEMYFESAAKEFKLIDDNGVNVVVNWGESMELIEQLKREGVSYQLMKKLSLYSVTLKEKDFAEMKKCGLVEETIEGVYIISDTSQYDEKIGLMIGNHWMDEVLIK